jgi:hypothetical protein
LLHPPFPNIAPRHADAGGGLPRRTGSVPVVPGHHDRADERRRRGWVRLALAPALATAAAALAAGCGGGSLPAGGGGSARFSPYVDVGLGHPFDFAAAARQTSVKSYTLGFIVASGGCAAAWGGGRALDSGYPSAQIAALRHQGGDVRVSFGGREGSELAGGCTSVSDLTRAYQTVVDRYRLTEVDFDLEGAALSDPIAMTRRWQSIKSVQDRAGSGGARLDLSLTLPTAPQGLTAPGLAAVRAARAAGVRVDHLNVLAMDFGDGPAPAPAGRMASYVEQAAMSVQRQVGALLGGGGAATWDRLSVTPMIGVNDVSDEVFTLGDARSLLGFARDRGLGQLSMWSITRDKRCPGGAVPPARPDCSGVDQAPYAFSRELSSLG